jgi:hypothetical protein
VKKLPFRRSCRRDLKKRRNTYRTTKGIGMKKLALLSMLLGLGLFAAGCSEANKPAPKPAAPPVTPTAGPETPPAEETAPDAEKEMPAEEATEPADGEKPAAEEGEKPAGEETEKPADEKE